ncbi:unnamed protein product [Urochloa humidicola]
MAAGRRHVHLCFTDHRDQTYALHHIDVDPLFLSEPDPDPESMDALPLPPPVARFQPPPEPNHVMSFHPLGDGRVVSIDELRRTIIYDASNGAVRAGPPLRDRKCHTLSVTVGDNLYLLDHIPLRERRRCFEAFVYEPHLGDWSWHKLPQPPYVHDPGYDGKQVVTHAVVAAGGGATAVWTCTEGVGTYSFDTARRAWRKEGDWALPFRGKAVRDDGDGGCGLWFGISSEPNRRLVAADLAAAAPPEVRGAWEEFRPPGEWFCRNAAVVHVGRGRLCTVRFFATDPTDKLWQTRGTVAVITAVEVEHDDHDGGIRMIRRRSACIKIPDYNRLINWVL